MGWELKLVCFKKNNGHKQITNLQQPYHSKLEKMFPYLQIKRGSSNVKAIMIFHIVWLSQCNTLALVQMSFTYYMIVFTLSLRGVQQDGWAGHHLDGASAILGDPGADSGDEGKSKRAGKYIWNEEK